MSSVIAGLLTFRRIIFQPAWFVVLLVLRNQRIKLIHPIILYPGRALTTRVD